MGLWGRLERSGILRQKCQTLAMRKAFLTAAVAGFLISATLAQELKATELKATVLQPAMSGVIPGQKIQEATRANTDLRCIPGLTIGSCWSGTFKVYRKLNHPEFEISTQNDIVDCVEGNWMTLSSNGTAIVLRRGEKIEKAVEYLGTPEIVSDAHRWIIKDDAGVILGEETRYASDLTLEISVKEGRMKRFSLSKDPSLRPWSTKGK